MQKHEEQSGSGVEHTPPATLYYLQDSRSYLGNDMLWWAQDGLGYTTDLSKAQVYTEEEAQRKHNSRESDIPWPKSYIDLRTRPAVDMQYCERSEALKGSAIVLIKMKKERRASYRCHECGSFMNVETYYCGTCPRCGARNAP